MKTNYLEIIIGIVAAVVRVFLAVAVAYFIYRGALIAYDYGYRVFAEPAVSTGAGRTVSVTISENMSARELGAYLEEKGLISDSNLFVLQYYASEYRKGMKSGVYNVSTTMTAEEMMAVFAGVESTEEEED